MDKKIEKAIRPLLEMYEKIENDLLIKIASHFSINEEFLNSDYWRIKKLEEMGLFNQDVIKYIARYSNKTEQEVNKALNQIGIDTININKLNKLFEDEVLKINPNILINNHTINAIINNAYNELTNHFIDMSSKIEKGVKEAYLHVVESAYLKTSMGTHSYQEAIRESINDLSNKGIRTVTYTTINEDGEITGIKDYDIEGIVRRDVLTASRKLSNDINMEVANQLESEYIYLSEHLQCRPQHFDWQGTIIKREDLVKVTDYGSITGLGGINCRHYFEAYFGDKRGKELKQYNEDECEIAYNQSQHQRYIERGIRLWKRKREMYKATEDVEAYDKCNRKIKEWQNRMKDYTDKTKLRRDYTREYVSENKNIQVKMYKDLTNKLKENFKNNPIAPERRLNYSLDSDDIKHYNYFFEDEKTPHKLDGEIEYQKLLEQYIGEEVYLNPKNKNNTKTPDFVIKRLEKTWDLKGIDGDSDKVIDNILGDACKHFQTSNIILKQRYTKHDIDYLSKKIKEVFELKHRKKIKEIMLFDKNDNLILYYKR